jgi:hypothetical protein
VAAGAQHSREILTDLIESIAKSFGGRLTKDKIGTIVAVRMMKRYFTRYDDNMATLLRER